MNRDDRGDVSRYYQQFPFKCVHDEKFIQLLSFCSRSNHDDDDDEDDEEEERRKIIQDEADNSFSKWQCVKLF